MLDFADAVDKWVKVSGQDGFFYWKPKIIFWLSQLSVKYVKIIKRDLYWDLSKVCTTCNQSYAYFGGIKYVLTREKIPSDISLLHLLNVSWKSKEKIYIF